MGIKVSYKLISIFWASKFPISWFQHFDHQSFLHGVLSLLVIMTKNSQSTQSNKFAISLQYLKKEVRNKVHFLHADKHQSFNKLVFSFLMEVARHVQSTQNRKLVMFLQHIKKKCRNCFCVLLWCKRVRYFTGVQSCSLLLVTIENFREKYWKTVYLVTLALLQNT